MSLSLNMGQWVFEQTIDLGAIMHVYVLTKNILILNSFEDMKELLEKRGNKYSSRPRFVLAQEMYVF